MHTLIAYSTKYGATKDCAERIAGRLPGQVALADLDSGTAVDLAPYDTVVVGTSIYIGKPRKAARDFCKRNQAVLLGKRLGLYLCCIQDLEQPIKAQLASAFPKALIAHASAMEALGGTVDFEKLGRADRVIMNMISGDLRKKTGDAPLSTIKDERIDGFVKQLLSQA